MGLPLRPLRAPWLLLLLAPLAAGMLTFGATYLIPPTFTASTSFLPPQQGQGGAATALAALGPLASLAGGSVVGRSTSDQYVALMRSVTVSDRLIDRFRLIEAYESRLRVDARRQLANKVRIELGKKDGLISVEVDDTNPERAAAIANRYVDELRQMTANLAVSEAQQRRVFFEQQLQQSRDRLAQAQQALQASEFTGAALRAEPKAAADGYAKLRAEVTAAEVRLQVIRANLTDSAPEVRQQQATLSALRGQLSQLEKSSAVAEGPGYIGRYREFKYQEALFELNARQFEIARVDESREGALIQVVDAATPPERKSKPQRSLLALAASALAFVLVSIYLLARSSFRRRPERPA